ncbi:MAG: transporter, Ompp1/FadL/TodX family protein [Leptospiraceae bacterium]|nr:transporter, Ompp1/FadL/TodX family protein [Leptospiraceae bacterium]
MVRRVLKFLCIFLLPLSVLQADAFHNINGFFGERATGLGGAFTAVSDDPSGGFYNPSGLAYAYDSSISLSASNYTIGKKSYENVLGPAQNYERNFRNYIPNFFGLVKEVGNGGRIAFTILNPINETFTRNDQHTLPIYYPTIASIRNYNRETYNTMHVGLSYAKAINSKFSLGASLYYTQDTATISSTSLVQYKDKSFVTNTLADNRTTVGLIPVLGVMYTPTKLLSFGASLRRQIVTGGNRLVNTFLIDSTGGTTDNIVFVEGTHSQNGGSVGNYVFKGPAYTGRVPETTELRLGTAIFPNSRMMGSFDMIYTSGFTFSEDNTEIIAGNNYTNITFTDNENLELKRYATTNFAAGFEYFLTEVISLRVGAFTNYANTKNQSWLTTAAIAANKSIAGDSEKIYSDGINTINYRIPFLRDNPRNEHVNNIGYSLGFSFSTSKASIGINIVKEKGRGYAALDSTRASQSLLYDATSIYVVVSSRSN